MSKPVKSESELIAMAKAELRVHADCPDGMIISVLRDGHSWEFRASADPAIAATGDRFRTAQELRDLNRGASAFSAAAGDDGTAE